MLQYFFDNLFHHLFNPELILPALAQWYWWEFPAVIFLTISFFFIWGIFKMVIVFFLFYDFLTMTQFWACNGNTFFGGTLSHGKHSGCSDLGYSDYLAINFGLDNPFMIAAYVLLVIYMIIPYNSFVDLFRDLRKEFFPGPPVSAYTPEEMKEREESIARANKTMAENLKKYYNTSM